MQAIDYSQSEFSQSERLELSAIYRGAPLNDDGEGEGEAFNPRPFLGVMPRVNVYEETQEGGRFYGLAPTHARQVLNSAHIPLGWQRAFDK